MRTYFQLVDSPAYTASYAKRQGMCWIETNRAHHLFWPRLPRLQPHAVDGDDDHCRRGGAGPFHDYRAIKRRIP